MFTVARCCRNPLLTKPFTACPQIGEDRQISEDRDFNGDAWVDLVWGAVSVPVMFAEFATGLGKESRTFGPDSAESRLMASSPGVAQAVNDYLTVGKAKGSGEFGLEGLITSNVNPVRQFVGGYTYEVTQASGGLNVTLYNETSVWSGTYHGLPNHQRSTFSPTGTTRQHYQVFVPCR